MNTYFYNSLSPGVWLSGLLLREAEGQREHHAESEAGGHPEGLRQTVTSHRRPIRRLPGLTSHLTLGAVLLSCN